MQNDDEDGERPIYVVLKIQKFISLGAVWFYF